MNGGIVILASCKYHSHRVHENLVQHPNNNISIILYHLGLSQDNFGFIVENNFDYT